MVTLHYFPSNANVAPHMLLEAIGAPFELALVDCDQQQQRSAAYLALNPHGRIPTLVDGDLVVYETAAICLYLVDKHPDAELAPLVGTASRAHFYKWLIHLTNTVQAEMRPYFYPEQHVRDKAHEEDVKTTAEARLFAMFRTIDPLLGDGPYLLGSKPSAVDHYLLMLVRWTRNMKKPASSLPNIRRHAERMLTRPAVMRAFATERLTPPYI